MWIPWGSTCGEKRSRQSGAMHLRSNLKLHLTGPQTICSQTRQMRGWKSKFHCHWRRFKIL
jgi:hypothetical protein